MISYWNFKTVNKDLRLFILFDDIRGIESLEDAVVAGTYRVRIWKDRQVDVDTRCKFHSPRYYHEFNCPKGDFENFMICYEHYLDMKSKV